MERTKPAIDPVELARRVEELRDKLAPQLPDIDPGDLVAIIECLLRPPGSGRRFFLRELRPGVHVF